MNEIPDDEDLRVIIEEHSPGKGYESWFNVYVGDPATRVMSSALPCKPECVKAEIDYWVDLGYPISLDKETQRCLNLLNLPASPTR